MSKLSPNNNEINEMSMCQSSIFLTLSAKFIFLCIFIFVSSFQEGLSHIGEKCKFVFFCLSKNSYCDNAGICRCEPNYPVNVTPHECRKARRYGNRCQYPDECTYTDKNSYCTQIPYRSICDCLSDYSYDSEKKICVKITAWKGESRSIVLPAILGVSLAAACILCCCLVAWRCFSLRSTEELRFLRRFSRRQNNTRNEIINANVPAHSTDTLPPYEMIIRENDSTAADELPPSYDDVMKEAGLQNKGKGELV